MRAIQTVSELPFYMTGMILIQLGRHNQQLGK
jgi:hypothetical protein